MSDYETKEGNGAAFKNKRKSEAKHPDFTGEVKVNGKMHFLDVWVKQTKAGDNYFSVRIGSEKQAKQNDDYQRPLSGRKPEDYPAVMAQQEVDAFSDEVPF